MNLYTSPRTINMASARVLAVDDEPDLCRMIAIWLHREGIACDTAHNVAEAVARLEQQHYDLVVTDIMMPGKSGIDLLDITRERFPATAIIMATAVGSRETAVATLEKGAFGYVIKPFDRNELVINVLNALERRRIILEHADYEKHLEQEVRDRTADIRNREEQIVLHLISASGYRDEETGEHIRRIGLFSAVLAKQLGLNQEQVDNIRIAAPMHDVGKIGIPDKILRKPGKLTEEEFAIIKKHPIIGARILGDPEIPLLAMAHDIALYHHERWDGSGYPYGLAGAAIPLVAQIVTAADVFDALSNDRVYRDALPEEQVLAIMAAGRGSHFNPEIFDCLLGMLPEFRNILSGYRDTPPGPDLVILP
ncbi:MAG: HD domain-containing phosphohydrolase [Desulfobulbaceae bacterium]